MADPTSTTPRTPPDLTGQQVGDYQLLRRLGRGGMADVYLAKQVSLKRNVALKILKPELAQDSSYVRRFEREAQAAAALVQSNIVQIYEVGHAEGYYFIAQEYVRGRNLKQYLDRYGAVEPVMALNVLRQTAMALQKATELGVIHRDIKPENIMLSTSGEIKITDFGLARINSQESEQTLTQIGVTMGTPLYMSPEQVGGLVLDHRSDIYSLGVTAYQMLVGEPPFRGDNALAIAVQHVNDPVPSLASARPDVPPDLIKIIERMLAKQPADRQADARQLLKELRAVKIDMDEDWELIVEKLSLTEVLPASETMSHSEAQLAATRQLQQVMRGHRKAWYRMRGLWLLILLAGVSGLVAGYLAAWETAPEGLLKIDNIQNETIPHKETVAQQYEAARWRPPDEQEQFYKAVMDYFPYQPGTAGSNTIQLYHRRAKSRLAELYLGQERWEDAESLYREFTSYNEIAEEFRATGHAGLAYVMFRKSPEEFPGGPNARTEAIKSEIREVVNQQSLLNEYMQQRFQEVLRAMEEPAQPTSV